MAPRGFVDGVFSHQRSHSAQITSGCACAFDPALCRGPVCRDGHGRAAKLGLLIIANVGLVILFYLCVRDRLGRDGFEHQGLFDSLRKNSSERRRYLGVVFEPARTGFTCEEHGSDHLFEVLPSARWIEVGLSYGRGGFVEHVFELADGDVLITDVSDDGGPAFGLCRCSLGCH